MPAPDIVQLAVLALAWLAVAVRGVLHVRDNRSPGSLWLTGSVAGVAAALTIGWPPLMGAIVPGGGGGLVVLRVGQHAAVLVAAVAATAFTAYATGPERAARSVRWRLALAALALLGLAGAGTVAVTHRPSDVDPLLLLGPAYARSPGVAGYLVLFTVVLGVCMVNVGVLCLRYRRGLTGRGMRAGLLLLATGSALGVVYSGLRVAGTVAAALGADLGGAAVSFAVTVAAVLLLVAGAIVTAVSRRSPGANAA